MEVNVVDSRKKSYVTRPMNPEERKEAHNPSASYDWAARLENLYQKTLDEFLQPQADIEDYATTWFIRTAHKEFPNTGEVAASPICLFSHIEYLIEFSVRERVYQSKVVFPDSLTNRDEFVRAVEILRDTFLNPRQDLVENGARERLLQRTAREKKVAVSEPVELYELMVPISRHLYQAHGQLAVHNGAFDDLYEVDGFNRSLLRNWKRINEEGAVRISGQSEALGEKISKSSVLNCYPYFCIHEIDARHSLMIVVNSLNENDLDEKVIDDQRIPCVTLAIIRTPDNVVSEDDRSLLCAYLNQLFDRLETTVTAYRFQLAMDASAGEAAAISRYWYGTGVVNLLGSGGEMAALEEEDVIDFWDRFVVEVLCARIPGIRNTEAYPFDRVYIMDWTGANEGEAADFVRLRVLEAALRSKNPQDLNQHLVSAQRVGQNLNKFDLVDKVIKHRLDFEVQYFADRQKFGLDLKTSQGFDRELDKSVEFHFEKPDDDDKAIELMLKMVLQMLRRDTFEQVTDKTDEDAFNLDASRGLLWALYQDMGIAYHYRHGLDLEKEIPSLFSLQSAYDTCLRSGLTRANELKDKVAQVAGSQKKTLSKVVYISYDPSLHPDTTEKIVENGVEKVDHLIPADRRFTMILVADDDPLKSSAEIEAEKKDLRLLIEMIVRQQLRDRKRERGALRKRLNILSQTLNQFVHRLNAEQLPERTKQNIMDIYEGLKPLLETNRRQLEPVSISPESGGLLEVLYLSGDRKGKGFDSVRSMLEDWRNANCQPYLSQGRCDGLAKLEYLRPTSPWLDLKIPKGVVRECFEVMFKNACEAASSERSGRVGEVVVQVLSRPDVHDKSGNSWFVELIVENTTQRIPAETIANLNSEVPTVLGENKSKIHSTGIGVATARSQLKDGVGHGADIRYVMIAPDRIQARMVLPARLNVSWLTEKADEVRSVACREGNQTAPTSAVGKKPTILYVEDNIQIAQDNLKFLKDMVSEDKYSIEWSSTFKGADSILKALKPASPVLVITDLDILKDDKSTHSDSKYGMLLLNSIFKSGADSKTPPPVWVVSGKTTGECEQLIAGCSDFGTSGYRVADDCCCAEPLAPGSLCLLKGVKWLDKSDIARAALERLAGTKEFQEFTQGDFHDVASEVRFTSGRLGKPTFDKKLSEYFEESKGLDDFRSIFVAAATAVTKEDLARVLSSWFKHQGMRDLELLEDATKPLYDTMIHKTIVLSLKVTPELTSNLPLGFSHWCVTRNIVVHSSDVSDQTIATLWFQTVKDRKGIFSVLRHDLNSLGLRFPDLVDDVQTMRERVNRADNMLSVMMNEEVFVHSDDPVNEVLSQLKLLSVPESGECAKMLRVVEELSGFLRTFIRKLPENEAQGYLRLELGLDSLYQLFVNF